MIDLTTGMRYGGSSITKGRSSPTLKYFEKILAEIKAITIPNKYRKNITILPALGKKAPIRSI